MEAWSEKGLIGGEKKIVMEDGSDIMRLVEDEKAFSNYVYHKFRELDQDSDGNLFLKELKPAVADIGAALGLPAQGSSPDSDHIYSEVMSNIVEPALLCFPGLENEKSVTQEAFLAGFRKVAEKITERLKEHPVIVAHSENTFEGSAIRRLLTNKIELEKAMNVAMETIPRDSHGRISKDYLRVALDSLAALAGLPPYGAISEMNKVVNNVFKMAEADDGKLVKEDEFKKLLTEILGTIMLQLEGNPISVCSNTVVHEPIASASSLMQMPQSN